MGEVGAVDATYRRFLPEAAVLLGTEDAKTPQDMAAQGAALVSLGAGAVLMKGGHANGATCHDILVGEQGVLAEFTAPRIDTKNTHGTGCTLSSSIAAGLAKGLNLETACREAHAYLQTAITRADELGVGTGHGPVHHFHAFWDR